MIKLGNKKIKNIFFHTVKGFNIGKASLNNDVLTIKENRMKNNNLVLSKENEAKNIAAVFTNEKKVFDKENN